MLLSIKSPMLFSNNGISYFYKERIIMNFKQIESFMYVAITGSFSESAKILYSSQPSISSRVKSLEEQVGKDLFKRTSSGVYLTKAGKTFLPYAQNILDSIEKSKKSIQKTDNIYSGKISIAFVFSGATYLLPKIVSAFKKEYPKVNLIVYTGHSEQVLDMVLTEKVTLGLVRSIYHPEIKTISSIEDEMILVFHPQHYFNTLVNVDIKEVGKEPFVLFKRETLDWILVRNVFKRADIEPKIFAEIDSIEAVKQIVMEGNGISILPKFSVEKEISQNKLKTISITDFPKIQRNFELIKPKEKEINKVTSHFIDLFKDTVDSFY